MKCVQAKDIPQYAVCVRIKSPMKLQDKISLALALCSVCILAILIGQRAYVTLPEMRRMQQQADWSEVELAAKAIAQQVRDVGRIAYDYGAWDDTLEYTAAPKDSYIKRNFIKETLENNSIAAVLIYNAAGDLLWSSGYDADEGVMVEPGRFLRDETLDSGLFIISSDQFRRAKRPVRVSGIIDGKHNPLIYAAVSIVRSVPDQDFGGTLVMVRCLNQALHDDVRDFTRIVFRLYSKSDVAANARLAGLAPGLPASDDDTDVRREHAGYRWLLGTDGKPAYLLEVLLKPPLFRDILIDRVTIWVCVLLGLTIVMLRLVLRAVVVKPIVALSRHLHTIRETANYGLRVASTGNDEIGQLKKESNGLVHYVELQENYLRDLNQTLMAHAMEDGLTLIANRRHFDTKLELHWRAYQQLHKAIYLLVLDVDNFKAYNDTHGHPQGDDVLRKVADTLHAHIRKNTDTVARYGGDEFAVILTDTNDNGANVTANKLLNAVRGLNIGHNDTPEGGRVTVSIGCAGLVPADDDHDRLVQLADEALYQAKHNGKDQVVFHFEPAAAARS
jgi:diguanylate cyclase (GGDEF)-like protein